MKTRAWYRATAIAFGAVLAAACVVSTSDDPDPTITDVSNAGSDSGGSTAADDGGQAGGGTSSGGSAAGGSAGQDPSGGAAGSTDPAGTCETEMDADCAACLEDSANGFSNTEGTGVWDECQDTYPCCEESARYVICMRLVAEDPDLVGTEFDGPEDHCAAQMLAGLEEDDASVEFYGLAADAFSDDETNPNCYLECFYATE